MPFSTAIFFDAFLHAEVFILACLVLFYVLKRQAEGQFEISFLKVFYLISAVFIARVCLAQVTWVLWPVVVVFLIVLAVALFLAFFEIDPKPAAISSVLLIAIIYIGGTSASLIYSLVFPTSPTFAEYVGIDEWIKDAVSDSKRKSERTRLAKEGVEAVQGNAADLMQHNYYDLQSLNFETLGAALKQRGQMLVAGDEVDILRENMAISLARAGFASKRRSLEAIQEADPTQTILMASFFAAVDTNAVANTWVETTPEILHKITEAVPGFSLGSEQEEAFFSCIELKYSEGVDALMRYVRTDGFRRENEPVFYGSLLAALVQSEYDIPMDRLVQDSISRALMNSSSLKGIASKHWKRQGKDPQVEWELALQETEIKVVAPSLAEEDMEPEPDPYIPISTAMGVVLVPNDGTSVDEWIVAANKLNIRGFVSVDDEVVILSTTGEMIRKGEQWSVDFQKFTYAFDITNIDNERVHMKAKERSWNGPGEFNEAL